MTEFLVSSVFISGAAGLACGIVFGGYIRRAVAGLLTWAGSKIGG